MIVDTMDAIVSHKAILVAGDYPTDVPLDSVEYVLLHEEYYQLLYSLIS